MNTSKICDGKVEKLNGALNVSAPGRPGKSWGARLWALSILIAVLFTMLWLGDKLNASVMALTRFMARAQAPLTAQFYYPARMREQITVVAARP